MVYPTLENYIKKSGLNKMEIARRTGTPASTFYAKLAGESDISLELALKVKEVSAPTNPSRICSERAGRPRRHEKGGRQWKQKRAPARRWTITALPTAKNAAPNYFAMSAAICPKFARAVGGCLIGALSKRRRAPVLSAPTFYRRSSMRRVR